MTRSDLPKLAQTLGREVEARRQGPGPSVWVQIFCSLRDGGWWVTDGGCWISDGGSPPLQRGGQNQKQPTNGQGGYITPAAWGVPTWWVSDGFCRATVSILFVSVKEKCVFFFPRGRR